MCLCVESLCDCAHVCMWLSESMDVEDSCWHSKDLHIVFLESHIDDRAHQFTRLDGEQAPRTFPCRPPNLSIYTVKQSSWEFCLYSKAICWIIKTKWVALPLAGEFPENLVYNRGIINQTFWEHEFYKYFTHIVHLLSEKVVVRLLIWKWESMRRVGGRSQRRGWGRRYKAGCWKEKEGEMI